MGNSMGNKIDSRWEITMRVETTTDLSGRTVFDFDHDEVLTNHTFGQTFNYVRNFFKTRGGFREYEDQHTSFENVNTAWDMFNLMNESDIPFHIDEPTFIRMFTEVYEGHLAEYSRWIEYETDAYKSFRETLIDKGIMLFTVYKNQTGLGRVLSETLYLKRIS